MEVGDYSRWHHLIFCEELENDDENFIVCWACEEPLWGGPAYKCLECNFHQHKSCTEDIEVLEHDLREIHHLIMIEEVDNGGKEEVVCLGCEEAILFGPAYKCSLPECTFLLHKSCIDISHVIHHNTHPEHPLFIRLPSVSNCCDVCRKYCRKSFFYRCFTCDFDIDIKCVSRWRVSAEACHQHALFPMRKQIQFTCEACAEESKSIAYQCSNCRVLIHRECAQFSRTIKTRTHDHSLTRTYSLSQARQHDNLLCQICFKKVNTEYAAYDCRACDYIAHLNCANDLKDVGKSVTPEVDATQLVYLVEGINLTEDERASPQEIKCFGHPQHNLILSNEKLMDDMRCEACMQFIVFAPFYGCPQCNYFLHIRCAKLPATIKRGIFHKHQLTLLSHDTPTVKLSHCYTCRRNRHGFTYSCALCKNSYFEWHWDIQCCLIPNILEHKGHQHSLYLARRRSLETCNACGGANRMNFVCTECNNFTLCFRCVTLPLIARYEYDTHLLELSYTREDDSEEYYCLICEEERDNPDHWFYYCKKCKFTAHTRCVIGENPGINYGRNFTHEDHEHPLTIVQKTKHSPPCDKCGKPFVDMAIECTRCKFKVHGEFCLRYYLKNLRKRGKLLFDES